jgi:hypothetical protein
MVHACKQTGFHQHQHAYHSTRGSMLKQAATHTPILHWLSSHATPAHPGGLFIREGALQACRPRGTGCGAGRSGRAGSSGSSRVHPRRNRHTQGGRCHQRHRTGQNLQPWCRCWGLLGSKKWAQGSVAVRTGSVAGTSAYRSRFAHPALRQRE